MAPKKNTPSTTPSRNASRRSARTGTGRETTQGRNGTITAGQNAFLFALREGETEDVCIGRARLCMTSDRQFLRHDLRVLLKDVSGGEDWVTVENVEFVNDDDLDLPMPYQTFPEPGRTLADMHNDMAYPWAVNMIGTANDRVIEWTAQPSPAAYKA